jgi:hypothetical protein
LTHIKNEKDYAGYSDSHSLIKMIAAGLKMEEIENSIWGPYTIVWYDSMLRTLNFARNDSRPLGFVNCPDSNSIWFGSEVYMMGAALDRNRFKIKLGAGGFVRMPDFEHWIWQQDDKKFEKIQFKKRVAVSYSTGSMHSWPQGAGWWGEDDVSFEHTSVADHPLKQEGSKSPLALPPPKSPDTAIPNSSGSGSGATRVEPFPDGGSEIVQPSYRYPLRRMGSGKEKLKWMPMANALGMERGDFLLFSLVNHSGTKRGTQVAMEGRMIAYSNEVLHFLGHVEVYGMVGLSMGMVDNSKSLWRGIVADIQMAKVGKSIHAKDYRYRFHLKDVEQDSADDPFKEKVKAGKKDEVHHAPAEIPAPEEDECCSTVEDCTKAQECVLLSKKNPKTQEQPATQAGGKQWIEEKESNDSGGLLHVRCDDCQQYFQRSSMHRVQEGEAADAIRLRFCGPCYNAFTTDASRLDTIFANAKLERATKFFHNDDGPFYDGERLPIVH